MSVLLSSSFFLHNRTPLKSSKSSNLAYLNKTNHTLNIFHKSLYFSIKTQPFPSISCSNTPKASQLTNFVQKGAILIVGSLLFLAKFSAKHALAVPVAPGSNLYERVDENDDIKKENLENDDLYVKILEKNPNDVEALKIVLYGKMKKGEMDEAVKYVSRLIELEPDEVEWRLLEGLSFELMGDLGKAKSLFREILKTRPLLIRALHGLALAMHKNREGSAVFEMLNKALELARHEYRVTEERNIRILIAQMHVVKGDLEGALKLFQFLVNEDHRDFRPYLCQGIIYSLLDKKEEADEQFEIYRNLIPEEFPERGFINDVILAAKKESQEQLHKNFESELSYKK